MKDLVVEKEEEEEEEEGIRNEQELIVCAHEMNKN
jgi:hypothetical protein